MCKSFEDCCHSEFPTLGQAASGDEKDRLRTLQYVCAAIVDYLNFKNRKNTMSSAQVGETAMLILDEYPFLQLDDLKFFVRRLKLNEYGQIFDLDGQVLIEKLRMYIDEKRDHLYLIEKERKRKEEEERQRKEEEEMNDPKLQAARYAIAEKVTSMSRKMSVNNAIKWRKK